MHPIVVAIFQTGPNWGTDQATGWQCHPWLKMSKMHLLRLSNVNIFSFTLSCITWHWICLGFLDSWLDKKSNLNVNLGFGNCHLYSHAAKMLSKAFPVLYSSYFCSFITFSVFNFQGEKVFSVCTPQSRLLLVQLIYDLAPSVKPHGPAIHHICDNGEQTSIWRSWLAPGRNNSLIWCWDCHVHD